MTFIKKQKLVEEVKEEPIMETITESVEDNLQSALLEVVADELNYVAKLNRMIELAEEAEKDDLVAVLKSSRASMKGNIAEVYRKSKKILGLVEEDEEPKEEVAEAVDPTKVYDGGKICDIISAHNVENLETNTAKILEDLGYSFDYGQDYTAQEIDEKIQNYNLDQETLEAIENEISALPDARQSRQQEFKSDLDSDVSTLESIVDENKLLTYAAKNRLKELIFGLKHIEYNGEPGVVWNNNDSGKNNVKTIA